MQPLASYNWPRRKGVYLVGGTVRDILLGHSPTDIDVCVLGDPKQFAQHVAHLHQGRMVFMGKQRQCVYRVVKADHIIDITPVNGPDIKADLLRRDFTINALAYDLSSHQLLDYSQGRHDLQQGRVRMVSPEAFQQDPLRLLRAFRMAAQLDFKIVPDTQATITQNAHLIQRSAGERIQNELLKIFMTPRASASVRLMLNTGLLTSIMPELTPLADCRQGRHHIHNVLEHTCCAFSELERMLTSSANTAMGMMAGRLDAQRAAWLKLALLLHDIGKPTTRSMDAKQRVHFYQHARVGSKMAETICARLRMSKQACNYIAFIIRHHQTPLSLYSEWQKGNWSRKLEVRFFRRSGNLTPDLLLHALADQAGKGLLPHADKAFVQFIDQLIQFYLGPFQTNSLDPPLITGHDLIHGLKLAPSPLFRELLDLVEEARLAGSVSQRQDALRLVRAHLERRSGL